MLGGLSVDMDRHAPTQYGLNAWKLGTGALLPVHSLTNARRPTTMWLILVLLLHG